MSNWKRRPLRASQVRYAGKKKAAPLITAEFQRFSYIIKTPKLSLHLVADAYCLLEVYTALKSNPSQFGLPDDLENICARQPEKSKDKKSKERQTEQIKQVQGKEFRLTSFCFVSFQTNQVHILKTAVEHLTCSKRWCLFELLSAPGVHTYSYTKALASPRCCTSKKNPPCGNQLSITLLSLSI